MGELKEVIAVRKRYSHGWNLEQQDWQCSPKQLVDLSSFHMSQIIPLDALQQ